MNLVETYLLLPERHRMLLVVVFLLLVFGMIYAMFFLLPARRTYNELRSDKASVEKDLAGSPWPLDSERCDALLKERQRVLDGAKSSVREAGGDMPGDPRDMGLRQQAMLVLKRATSMFDQNIINAYGDINNFMTKASQTEYKDIYDRTDSMLQGMKVVLEPSIFGMDESTADPAKYQMILKLWTVQRLVRCARDNNLRIANEPSLMRAGLGRPSKISVLPMIAYRVDEGDKAPYLLEFPVRLEVEGTMDNFIKFVQSLQAEDCFLPMKQMELLAEQPPPALHVQVDPDGKVYRVVKTPRGEVKRLSGENGQLLLRNITAVVVCSSFFRASVTAPVPTSTRQVVEPLPLGL